MLSIFVSDCFAQLKVKGENGKVIVGQDRVDDSSEDQMNILSMSIFGKNDYSRSGSKLSFGDFGSYNRWGWNVFIGEKDTLDTDQLWLHGKNGFAVTYGRAESNYHLLSFDVNNPIGFRVNSEIVAQGYKIISNKTERYNVKNIENSYEKIMQLTPLTYKYLPYRNTLRNGENIETNSLQHCSLETIDSVSLISELGNIDMLSERFLGKNKEEKDSIFFEEWSSNMSKYAIQKNGFDVDNVKNLFPELVSIDNEGNAYIDYIGIIPLLVQAIQEQSKVIIAQSLKLKELEQSYEQYMLILSNQDTINTKTIDSIYDGRKQNAVLFQNTPNPFNKVTEVKYFLPDGINNASIYIFDLQGVLLSNYSIESTGFGSVMIDGSSLEAGMYIYTLVVDGTQVASKRMILTD